MNSNGPKVSSEEADYVWWPEKRYVFIGGSGYPGGFLRIRTGVIFFLLKIVYGTSPTTLLLPPLL